MEQHENGFEPVESIGTEAQTEELSKGAKLLKQYLGGDINADQYREAVEDMINRTEREKGE